MSVTNFIFDHKWKAAGLLLVVQTWLATDFFKRASFGVAVDGALLLGSVLLVLAVALYVGSWVSWYLKEVLSCYLREQNIVLSVYLLGGRCPGCFHRWINKDLLHSTRLAFYKKG